MSRNIEEAKTHPPLDAKRVHAIIFTSFFFSQGDNDMQGDMFRYIHRIRPEWHIDLHSLFPQLIEDKVFQEKIDRVALSNGKKHTTHLVGGKRIDAASSRNALVEEIHSLRRILSGEREDTEYMNELLATLTWTIIEADHLNIVEKGGRTRDLNKLNGKNGTLSPYDDPFHSHFCYYVLGENSTHIPEFDQMFLDIRNSFNSSLAFLEPKNRKNLHEKVSKLIEVYNEHHPNLKAVINFTK